MRMLWVIADHSIAVSQPEEGDLYEVEVTDMFKGYQTTVSLSAQLLGELLHMVADDSYDSAGVREAWLKSTRPNITPFP